MKLMLTDTCAKLWLSARETDEWAHRSGACWPCSTLAGKRLFAEFDRNGLVDFAVSGRSADCDVHELDAITSDFLRPKLTRDHALHFVTVGQFSAP